jgi:hypothetical protein
LLGSLVSVNNTIQRKFQSMPRNSVGLWKEGQQFITHYWRPEGGNGTGGFFNSTQQAQGNFLWVMAGAAVGDTLYLVASEIHNTNTGLKFEGLGTTLLAIDTSRNPDCPMCWNVVHVPMRFTDTELQFGSAVVVGNDGFMYVLGSHKPKDAWLPRGVMLRFPVNTLADCVAGGSMKLQECARFLIGYAGNNAVWDPFTTAQALQTVVQNVPPETTITFHPLLGWLFLEIGFGSTEVMLRTSATPYGPWSPQSLIYTIGAPFNDSKKFFCYAPKVHVNLLRLVSIEL